MLKLVNLGSTIPFMDGRSYNQPKFGADGAPVFDKEGNRQTEDLTVRRALLNMVNNFVPTRGDIKSLRMLGKIADRIEKSGETGEADLNDDMATMLKEVLEQSAAGSAKHGKAPLYSAVLVSRVADISGIFAREEEEEKVS